LADAPGHQELLRSMLSRASQAEAAVLLIDAAEGVPIQSRLHGYLLTLLGVKQLAVVINKMDIVNWDKGIYHSIVDEYTSLLGLLHRVSYPLQAILVIMLSNVHYKCLGIVVPL